MRKATQLIRALQNWRKSRPMLEIEESATWFLLVFAYAHGLTTEGLGFKMVGVIPQVTAPQMTLAITLFCLAVSVVVLIEPLLPSRAQSWTKEARTSLFGQCLRGISVFFAFVLGMLAGFSLLVDKVPTMSWLIASVAYVGFLVFVILGIKIAMFAVMGCWQTGRPSEGSNRR